ncbi:MAG: coproporphyrinogen III oxidase, partial [Mariprofundaceae bacterium]|nr:coproporphyrinogen III oxidase [Mariprofundaceae bacterium]
INSDESLNLQQAAAEAVWVGLRRKNGIDNTWFSKRFDKNIMAYFQAELNPWLQDNKLIWQGQQLQLTQSGTPLADAIAESVI